MKKTMTFILGLVLIAVSSFAAENSAGSVQEKAFALAKEPSLSSFKYELTDDLEGVRITEYHGDDIHILIPEKIEEIPVRELATNLFSRKYNIETVIIPNTVQTIGSGLFSDCRSLKNVHLSTAITSLPIDTFSGCESLESFIIPTHITNIESLVFSNSGLKSIFIPDTVTFFSSEYLLDTEEKRIARGVSRGVFYNCKNLETVRLPSSMTVIGSYMFSGCNALSNIILPKGLTEIGETAFAGCTSLAELIIPNTVTVIREGAFNSIGVKSLVIPDSVNVLKCSFAYCRKLEYLRLPNTLTEIGDQLLSTHYSGEYIPLKSVNLPTSLKRVDNVSLSGLELLQELIIPDSITELEFPGYNNQAFKGTALPLVTQKRLKQLGYPGKF